MVSTRAKRAEARSPIVTTENKYTNVKKNNAGITARKETRARPGPDYEQFRDQRIKENKERMQKLGILDLALKLKPHQHPPKKLLKNVSSATGKKPNNNTSPQRRSSRLKSLTPVNYSEGSQKVKPVKKVEIRIREGTQPEIYTDEHEKLLGDCEAEWTLYVDGCGEDGKRVYDQENGESCHQCRQKTLGLRTHCSKCNLVQGQFCGDCLYMRYGENVIEANKNPNWICPVCRGICNCSLCRKAKGWEATGNLYRKVTKLGFKSVAHYLIQTRRTQNHSEKPGETPDKSSDPQPDNQEDEMEEEDKQQKYIALNSNHVTNCGYDDNNGANDVDDEDICVDR